MHAIICDVCRKQLNSSFDAWRFDSGMVGERGKENSGPFSINADYCSWDCCSKGAEEFVKLYTKPVGETIVSFVPAPQRED